MAASDVARWEQLRAAFAIELEERTRELNRLLLALERDGDGASAEALPALFREAHSLKGAARAVELPAVEELAHALEAALAAPAGGLPRPRQPPFDALFRAVDALTPLAGQDAAATAALPALLRDLAAADPLASAPASTARADAGAVRGGTDGNAAPAGDQSPHTAGAAAMAATGAAVASPSLLGAAAAEALPAHSRPAPPTATGAASRPSADAQPAAAAAPLHDGSARVIPAAARPAAAPPRAPDTVRVAIGKLDGLLAQSGELVVTTIRLEERLRDLGALGQGLEAAQRQWRETRGLQQTVRRLVAQGVVEHAEARQALDALLRVVEQAERRNGALLRQATTAAAHLRQNTAQLAQVSGAIEEAVMAARLLPVSTIFGPLERMVRDLARELGKEVALELQGGGAEVDRKILDGLRDPLLHMLRNAIDHGIEPPAERRAHGKPAAGTIVLAAAQRGSVLELTLRDDGAGLDPAAIRAAAVRKGLLSEEQAAALDDAAARDLIFEAGFSTRSVASATSGRGVGMDVVRESIKQLRGELTIDSTPGEGTRFVLRAPLSLVTTRAIVLELGGQLFALPSFAVEGTWRARASDVVLLEGRPALQVDGVALPTLELAALLGLASADRSADDAAAWRPYLVLRQGDRRVACFVDRLLGEQEFVVKNLGWPLRAVRQVAGAAVDAGSGRLVVVLNANELALTAVHALSAGLSPRAERTPVAPRAQPRVLVVDDSLTTRALERSILEAAGYRVGVAGDGAEALALLRQEPFDLVISDVDMPRMHGFALTSAIRADRQLHRLPVILLTSLDDVAHREQGARAGADAYLVKGGFDQGRLLETIGRLL